MADDLYRRVARMVMIGFEGTDTVPPEAKELIATGVFGAILSPANVTGVSAAPAAAVAAAPVNILHLALGPVDLNLLGLQVGLDNCHNGPVTVDER